MSAMDDTTTLGRARLSFASEVRHRRVRRHAGEVRERRDRPGSVARVPAGARHVRPAPGGRRPDAARQDPAGRARPSGSCTRSPTSREQYSRGFGHITTRQNIQLHFVKLHDVEPAMRRLAEEGLTTREACGNSVRNITACPWAGVSADELFDVTPYAEALTRYFLRHRSARRCRASSRSPSRAAPRTTRSRRSTTSAGARVVRDEDGKVRGFRVAAGGGTATMCRSAAPLHEFLPVADMFASAEADRARVPQARRLQAQAQEPDEVPDQVAGMGGLQDRVRERSWQKCSPKACRRCRSIPRRRRSSRRPTGRGRRRRRPNRWRVRVQAQATSGPAFIPSRRPVLERGERRVRRVAAPQRPRRRSRRLRGGDRHAAARRHHRRSSCACSRSLASAYGDGTRAPDDRSGPHRAMGADRRCSSRSTRGWPPPASAWPKRACRPTSQAVRAPSRAGSR